MALPLDSVTTTRRVFVSCDVLFEEGYPHCTSPIVGEAIQLFNVLDNTNSTLDDNEEMHKPANNQLVPANNHAQPTKSVSNQPKPASNQPIIPDTQPLPLENLQQLQVDLTDDQVEPRTTPAAQIPEPH